MKKLIGYIQRRRNLRNNIQKLLDNFVKETGYCPVIEIEGYYVKYPTKMENVK